jgi:hypothetical protein
MKRKSVENLLERINESNIDDSIYFYASLLEQLVELKKEFDNSDDDSSSDYVNNSDDDSDNSDDSDLPHNFKLLLQLF